MTRVKSAMRVGPAILQVADAVAAKQARPVPSAVITSTASRLILTQENGPHPLILVSSGRSTAAEM